MPFGVLPVMFFSFFFFFFFFKKWNKPNNEILIFKIQMEFPIRNCTGGGGGGVAKKTEVATLLSLLCGVTPIYHYFFIRPSKTGRIMSNPAAGGRRHPACCPDSNSNSFNPIFTKPGQKLYIDYI